MNFWTRRMPLPGLVLLLLGLMVGEGIGLAEPATPKAPADPSWVEPMQKVHTHFTGTRGTLACFGDSITVTLAFWSPLGGEPRNMPVGMARAHALVKGYMKPECWNKWKGPAFGNNGSMTIRWAHDNIDTWLKKLNPEVVVLMFGTNDLGQLRLDEYAKKTREVVDHCLKNGTVVILTTIPPRSGRLEQSRQFAEAVRQIAQDKHLPLVDYQAEILKRRPEDWDGALPQFKGSPGDEYQVPTLLARDGVHPSNPRPYQDYSEESLGHNGYLLRNYLTLLAYADVIGKVLQPAPGPENKPNPDAVSADPVAFTPLSMPQGNTENRTGMWFCPDLGQAGDILPLKTRVWATKESVTGGVAMKCLFEKGSRGILAFEKEAYPAGSAGITLYARASRPLSLKIGNVAAQVGADWKKLDFPWERLGTSLEKPRLGFQLIVAVQGPIQQPTWLILDRIGTESPRFDANPKIEPQTGPDVIISSKEILYGGENLARTRERARAKQPFKIIALGDSVTAGAQMSRGTWAVKGAEGIPFLYFSHLARLAEEHFQYQGITPVQHGHGGWTAARALTVVDREVVDEAGPNDLVILQFGGNDLSWARVKPAAWKADMKKLIARVKTRTDQILLVSTTPIGEVAKLQSEITRILQELVQEEKVAAADITRLAYYRGEAFAWAWLANEGHPAYMGHILMAEMMAPLLTEQHRTYPE